MQEIVIAGYSLEELKKIQNNVRKDANKHISDNIEAGTKLVKEMVALAEETDFDVEEDGEDFAAVQEVRAKISGMAEQADSHFDTARTVAQISGVSFYIPFNEDWASGNALTDALEDANLRYDFSEALEGLADTLEDMEYASKNWHSSRC
jgi:hypothetical protein